jgi:hypothetical protein
MFDPTIARAHRSVRVDAALWATAGTSDNREAVRDEISNALTALHDAARRIALS